MNTLYYYFPCSCEYDPRVPDINEVYDVYEIYAENEKQAAGEYANRLVKKGIELPDTFVVRVGGKEITVNAVAVAVAVRRFVAQ